MILNAPQYFCPICKSDNTCSFQAIYQICLESDFSRLILERNIKFNGKRDQTKFRQLMLERTTPPPKPTIGSLELFIAVFGGIVGMIIGIIINDILKAFFLTQFDFLILIFTIFGYLKTLHLTYRYKTLKKRILWKTKLAEWENSQICLKCGGTWQE